MKDYTSGLSYSGNPLQLNFVRRRPLYAIRRALTTVHFNVLKITSSFNIFGLRNF